MTVSSSTTYEPDVKEVVTHAFRKAGLMDFRETLATVDPAFSSHGRKALERIIDELPVHGIFARAVPLVDVDIVAGTQEYTLSSSYLDVVNDAMFLSDAQGEGQTLVKQIAREDWQVITNKDSSGRPARFYVDRTGDLKILLWPVPSEAGTLTVEAHRLLADVQDENATVDLQRYWMDYLVHALAHQLATDSSVEMPRVLYLGKLAQMKLRQCRRYARQREVPRTRLHHPTYSD